VATELADWWEDFHLGDDDEREALLQDLRATMPPKVRRVPAAEAAAPRAPAGPAAQPDAVPPEGDAAPRKRRRRRRTPAGEGGGPGAGESRPATRE
jgi:poly(A) polymerase